MGCCPIEAILQRCSFTNEQITIIKRAAVNTKQHTNDVTKNNYSINGRLTVVLVEDAVYDRVDTARQEDHDLRQHVDVDECDHDALGRQPTRVLDEQRHDLHKMVRQLADDEDAGDCDHHPRDAVQSADARRAAGNGRRLGTSPRSLDDDQLRAGCQDCGAGVASVGGSRWRGRRAGAHGVQNAQSPQQKTVEDDDGDDRNQNAEHQLNIRPVLPVARRPQQSTALLSTTTTTTSTTTSATSTNTGPSIADSDRE